MTEIKKLTLESDFGVLKKQSIEFSTDEQKPLTVIIGKNGGGKTTLVNAIKIGLSLEPAARNAEEIDKIKNYGAKPVLETTFDSSFVSKENEFLFFPDMERWGGYIKQTPDRLKQFSKQFSNQSVADKMNEFKGRSVNYRMHKMQNSKFIFDETGNLRLIDEDGLDCIESLAAAESLFVNLIWVLAARHFVAPNSFLVLDNFLGRLSFSHRADLIPLLFSRGNFSQIIWLVSDTEYLGRQTGLSAEPIPSLRELILKKQVLGKEYKIVDGYVVPFGGK